MGKSSKSITLALIGSALIFAGCAEEKPEEVAGEWSEGEPPTATATEQANGTNHHRGGGLIIVPIPRVGGGYSGGSGGGGGATSAPSSRGGFGSSGSATATS